MATSESKGRFFLQNESNRIDSNREMECSICQSKASYMPASPEYPDTRNSVRVNAYVQQLETVTCYCISRKRQKASKTHVHRYTVAVMGGIGVYLYATMGNE